MILRTVGKILSGRPTMFQLVAACVIGAVLGLLPGLAQAPGSVLLLIGALLILNANVWIATAVTVVAKLLSVALLPVAHGIGVFLLDGPTQDIFRGLVNAPFLAWCGFEFYAVTGAWALGGFLGLNTGVVMTRIVRPFRIVSIGLDGVVSALPGWTQLRWGRLLSRLLLGGAPTAKNLARVARGKRGIPVRPLGAACVAGLALLMYLVPALLSEPVLTAGLRRGLEQANGATVDLSSADLDLAGGRITLNQLAMADRGDLDKDLLRAATVTADVDVRALLARKWRIDELSLVGTETGAQREEPGEQIGDDPVVEAPPEEDSELIRLEDIIADAEVWKERLRLVRRAFDLIAGDDDAEVVGAEGEPADAEREAELDRQLETVGRRWTRASHLIEESPTLQIDYLKVADLQAVQLGGKRLSIEGWNFSTHPDLVPDPTSVIVSALDQSFRVAINPAGEGGAPSPQTLEFSRIGLSGDALGDQVRVDGDPVMAGGTIDIEGSGRWWRDRGLRVDIPIVISLHGSRIRIPGTDDLEEIDELVLPVVLRGRLIDPRILFRQSDLVDALVAAGKRELANRFRGEVTDKIDEEKNRLRDRLSEELEGKVDKETKDKLEKIGGGLLDKLGGGGGNR